MTSNVQRSKPNENIFFSWRKMNYDHFIKCKNTAKPVINHHMFLGVIFGQKITLPSLHEIPKKNHLSPTNLTRSFPYIM